MSGSQGDRINFFGIQDDKLIYDERKKRFLHTSDMPRHLSRQYKNNTFKSVSHPNHPHLPHSNGQISTAQSRASFSGSLDSDNSLSDR